MFNNSYNSFTIVKLLKRSLLIKSSLGGGGVATRHFKKHPISRLVKFFMANFSRFLNRQSLMSDNYKSPPNVLSNFSRLFNSIVFYPDNYFDFRTFLPVGTDIRRSLLKQFINRKNMRSVLLVNPNFFGFG